MGRLKVLGPLPKTDQTRVPPYFPTSPFMTLGFLTPATEEENKLNETENEAEKHRYKSLQKIYKLVSNSIYGFICMKSGLEHGRANNYFTVRELGALVTDLCRKLLSKLSSIVHERKIGTVVRGNTDGIHFMVVDVPYDKIHEYGKIATVIINKQLKEFYQTDAFEVKFENASQLLSISRASYTAWPYNPDGSLVDEKNIIYIGGNSVNRSCCPVFVKIYTNIQKMVLLKKKYIEVCKYIFKELYEIYDEKIKDTDYILTNKVTLKNTNEESNAITKVILKTCKQKGRDIQEGDCLSYYICKPTGNEPKQTNGTTNNK